MKNKMNVMQVCRMYYPMLGGIERIVQDIAEGLCQETNMSVLTCQVKGAGSEEEINGVKVYRCSSMGTFCSLPVSPAFLMQFRKKSRMQDIIHIHMPFPLADLACLLSGYKGKVVLWWHSDVVRQKKMMYFYRPIMERLLKRADVIMVATEGHIEGSSYLGPYRSKCRVIPFGVERGVLDSADKYLCSTAYVRTDKSGNQTDAEIKFLFIGRLVYYKGCEVLLQALKHVEGACLTVIGDGVLKGELEQISSELEITDRVRFLGSVSNEVLKQELAGCDVFVLPSIAKSEAFGIVQMEAMAYGKPVINTKLPSGVPYVSIDKQTGLTVEPGDDLALADAMQWLIEHPLERQQFGEAAAKRVREYFNVDYMIEEVLKVYRELQNR
ncbi:hypothetical protein C0033_08665 [Clostridium sp. chh4-2]|uniref:glycosyltransferase n=1 Tax=Clostridium sp. chh4-2 TaxID=2067550 RepID=UPI000CCE5156|nr:glycosyltransferase [Clostridium sp. chh4-2]PNV62620.1 hypothetical protein C0033_08665 [Clostridium sp. chh4-2]